MSSDRSSQPFGSSGAPDADAGDDAEAEVPQPGLFASPGFLRLWIAQVVSSFGDWIGLLAILVVANRVGGDQPGAAITLVITARILPGFFLASAGGIIVDRFNRKRLLVVCDIVRASVLLTIPFIDRVWALVLASLALELATSLWSPAKEAIVPNIVPARHLTAANSLGMVAAYGTFFVGGLAFAGMAKLGAAFGWTDVGQVEMALVVDSATFLVAATLIATLPLAPHITAAHRKRDSGRRIDWSQGFRDLREGWDFIFLSPQVRAVLVGLSTGMIAGGMLIPLSVVFNDEILGAGSAGHSTILVVMGVGAGVGVSLVTLLQSIATRRSERTGSEPLGRARQFVTSLFLAGGALGFAATVSISIVAYAAVLVLGVAAGSVYVTGVTLLHENVEEVLRGRIFATMFTLVRFFVLVGMAMGGFLSDGFNWLFDELFDNRLQIGDWELALPGVRGALWLGSLLMLLAGALAALSLRGRRGVGRRAPQSAGSTEDAA